MAGRRAARRTALFLLYQWDLTGKPLASLYAGEVDPFALETAQAVSIPILGMGGITTPADAVEFMLAGEWCRRRQAYFAQGFWAFISLANPLPPGGRSRTLTKRW